MASDVSGLLAAIETLLEIAVIQHESIRSA
jgi:hypothetical protein